MNVTVEVQGLDRIDRATARVRQSIADELAKGMFVSVKRVEGEAKKSILQGQKSGKEYKRGTVTHRASAPGEAPASDTGLLANSVRGDLDRSALAKGVLDGTVSASARHARPLEFGTFKMAARPFLHPALEKSKAFIRERLNKAVRDGVLKVTKR